MEMSKIIQKVQTDGYCVIENFLGERDLKLMQELTRNYTVEKGNNLGKYAIGYKSLIIKLKTEKPTNDILEELESTSEEQEEDEESTSEEEITDISEIFMD